MEIKDYEIISSESRISWTGRKINGSHNGTIDVISGTLVLEDGKFVAGKFTIDTTSIKILDITDPGINAQFAGHLASDDFFASGNFPVATFETTSVIPLADTVYHVTGDLIIKGITAPLSFDASVDIGSDALTATGKLTVDRTKYNMKFRSGNFFKDLGDTLIYNDFELNINIIAKAA